MRLCRRVAVLAPLSLLVALLTSTPADASGAPAEGFLVPKGATVSLTGSHIFACNATSWGYILDGGLGKGSLGTHPGGCGTVQFPDAEVGPFDHDVRLDLYLQDDSCSRTYVSDGTPVDHFSIFPDPTASNAYVIGAVDAGGFCENADKVVNGFTGGNLVSHLRENVLEAHAPAPQTVERATSVALHGSANDASAKYEWAFTAGSDCPTGTELRNTTMTGQDVRFTALCSLEVALTARTADGRTSAPDRTSVNVKPRGGAFDDPAVQYLGFKATHSGDLRADNEAPTVSNLYAGGVGFAITVSDCSTSADADQLYCPDVPVEQQRQVGQGYTAGTISEPGAPFDGFSYVSGSSITIRKVSLWNPYIPLDGTPYIGRGLNWYMMNVVRGADVAGFIAAVTRHEGNTPVGHVGLLQAALNNDPLLGPRRALESVISTSGGDQALSRGSLQASADKVLDDNAEALAEESGDGKTPLIKSFDLYFYQDGQGQSLRLCPVAVGGGNDGRRCY